MSDQPTDGMKCNATLGTWEAEPCNCGDSHIHGQHVYLRSVVCDDDDARHTYDHYNSRSRLSGWSDDTFGATPHKAAKENRSSVPAPGAPHRR